MTEINLAQIDAQSQRHDIWRVRGIAIDNYAQLEQSLYALLAHLARTGPGIAAVIFFKITKSRAQ